MLIYLFFTCQQHFDFPLFSHLAHPEAQVASPMQDRSGAMADFEPDKGGVEWDSKWLRSTVEGGIMVTC